jgi:hypothetical protein
MFAVFNDPDELSAVAAVIEERFPGTRALPAFTLS